FCALPVSSLFPYTTLFRSSWVRGCSLRRGNADRRTLRPGGLRRRRFVVRLDQLLEPPCETLHLPIAAVEPIDDLEQDLVLVHQIDRKSTRLNSSHGSISYA